MIEVVSHIVRTVVPIRVWLPFLLSRREFSQPLLVILLPTIYCAYKATEILFTLQSLIKLAAAARRVAVGRSASEEDLAGHDGQCAVCQDALKRPVVLVCRHIFCEDCISEWAERQHSCPMCRIATAHNHGGIPYGDGATRTAPHVL